MLSDKFTRIIAESQGENGRLWLRRLPEIIREIENDWAISVKTPFQNLSYHFVAPCVLSDGAQAVLKIAFPEENTPIFNEAEMLKLYDGAGAARFLKMDEARFALLLERLFPGETLKAACGAEDKKATRAFIEILKKIIRKPLPEHNFTLLDDWFDGFKKAEKTDFPAHIVKKARRFYDELRGEAVFLLHGDFHHENILSAEREPFLAIDPKGIVGDLGYEISVFLNNHVRWFKDEPDLREKINFAVLEIASAFEIEPEKLRRWAFEQCVLSAWWTFEENGENWRADLALAEIWDV